MSNPMLDNAGTHFVTAKLKWIGEVLHQLWLPANGETHMPEWRPVEIDIETSNSVNHQPE